MASTFRYCPSCLLSIPSSTSTLAARVARPTIAARFPSTTSSSTPQPASSRSVTTGANSANAQKYKRKDLPKSARKKKAKTSFDQPDLKDMEQFALVDAMRYLRAAEVGQPPQVAKYELHVRLRTVKNGAVVRNRMRLPHPVKTDLRICVICPPGSAAAKAAKAAGATLVGDEAVFAAIKAGTIDFDRAICHVDSVAALNAAGVARVLGPRGLMPSSKMGTVVKDVAATVRDMMGGTEYRERFGTVRLAVGQLAFTPEQVAENIRAVVDGMKKDMGAISDRTPKEIHEIVLSSTHGPGMSLNGEFAGEGSVPTQALATPN